MGAARRSVPDDPPVGHVQPEEPRELVRKIQGYRARRFDGSPSRLHRRETEALWQDDLCALRLAADRAAHRHNADPAPDTRTLASRFLSQSFLGKGGSSHLM